MSRCTVEAQNLLLAVHGELPVGERLSLWLHWLICPECRQRWRELSQTSQVLAQALSPTPVAPRAGLASVPVWAAVAVCLLALSAAGWAARSYFAPSVPDHCFTDDEISALQRCPSPANAVPPSKK